MRNEAELLVDCVARLNGLGLDYMLVGSMASNYWGMPRTTHDLDFVIAIEPRDAERFAAAFRDGFFVQLDSIRRVFTPPHQFNAIDESSALKIDFWLLKQDDFERTAFERRRQVTLFGTPAWITTAEDVILHKLFWDKLTPSDRQLHDAAGVWSVQANSLDMDYLRFWATRLNVATVLEELMQGKPGPKLT